MGKIEEGYGVCVCRLLRHILHRRGLVGCVLEAELVHVAAAWLRLVVTEPLAPLFDVPPVAERSFG